MTHTRSFIHSEVEPFPALTHVAAEKEKSGIRAGTDGKMASWSQLSPDHLLWIYGMIEPEETDCPDLPSQNSGSMVYIRDITSSMRYLVNP